MTRIFPVYLLETVKGIDSGEIAALKLAVFAVNRLWHENRYYRSA